MLDTLTLGDIENYLKCPYFYYMTKKMAIEGQMLPRTTVDIPALAIQQALVAHATGKYTQYSYSQLVRLVWKTWFNQRAVADDTIKAIEGFADLRNQILMPFLTGSITNRSGKTYKEPRMTRRFKNDLEKIGYFRAAESMEESLLKALYFDQTELSGVGRYFVLDAYSDSLLMSFNYTPPAPNSIIGVNMNTVVSLSNERQLLAKADFVYERMGESVIEVHDCTPVFNVESAWIGRHPSAIAAKFMQAGSDQGSFPVPGTAIYRHWMSGKTMEKTVLNESRLIFAIEMARRGIEADIYIPMYLGGDLSRCFVCSLKPLCISGHDDILEWYIPGLHDIGKRVDIAAKNMNGVDKDMLNQLYEVLDNAIVPTDVLFSVLTHRQTVN